MVGFIALFYLMPLRVWPNVGLAQDKDAGFFKDSCSSRLVIGMLVNALFSPVRFFRMKQGKYSQHFKIKRGHIYSKPI